MEFIQKIKCRLGYHAWKWWWTLNDVEKPYSKYICDTCKATKEVVG